jgi:hypothetical protein
MGRPYGHDERFNHIAAVLKVSEPKVRIQLRNDTVVTHSDFTTFIHQLLEPASRFAGSLEEYLRSVLRVVAPHHAEPPTWRLLAQLFSDAFTTPPLPFNSAWLEHTTMPRWTRPGQFSDVQAMLCYQIADLHCMAEDGRINDPMRYFGIRDARPGSTIWYNFTPASYLECASTWVSDSIDCEWADLCTFLVEGQTYE